MGLFSSEWFVRFEGTLENGTKFSGRTKAEIRFMSDEEFKQRLKDHIEAKYGKIDVLRIIEKRKIS